MSDLGIPSVCMGQLTMALQDFIESCYVRHAAAASRDMKHDAVLVLPELRINIDAIQMREGNRIPTRDAVLMALSQIIEAWDACETEKLAREREAIRTGLRALKSIMEEG